MNRGVSLAVLALVACSSKSGPPKSTPLVGAWKLWLPPAPEGSMIYDMFDDATGIWRCVDDACVHYGPGGGETARFELPCGTATRAASPSGTLYAVSCFRGNNADYDIYIIDLKTLSKQTFKMSIGFRIVVDDTGIVTATSYPVHDIARASSTIPARVVPIGPPTATREMVLGVETNPASAPWLGFTFGGDPSDLGWRDDGKSVALGGELVAELDEGLLVRTAQDRYLVVGASGTRTLAEGSPKMLTGPPDMRLAEGGWGRNGFFIDYGTLVQLRDRDGHVVHTVAQPADIDAAFSADRTGTRLELRYDDGHVMIWDPPPRQP